MIDGVSPGVGEISEDIAVLVALCERNFFRQAHIAIARVTEVRIMPTQRASDLSLSLHEFAHLEEIYFPVDLYACCYSRLLKLGISEVHLEYGRELSTMDQLVLCLTRKPRRDSIQLVGVFLIFLLALTLVNCSFICLELANLKGFHSLVKSRGVPLGGINYIYSWPLHMHAED